ncbi:MULTISPECIES: folate-binding protein YgfZ [unclassified Microbacterium]|uniref:CAF17-like 4Fe-4S cluster assembly/insertion protein YgfZ n=1 Tax=unclassified Microbacterium TaxID=2609290 RepID=UPI000CFB128D|nr:MULTISPECIES: glycine cleavage T C-terminal barrel domain-containing protein [unclassified Microbacterium]PQZ52849.1 folate-binding protein YgfZ [Microbacterium sp. MYb43]PQZ74624.1 folate-binding protein YgfZ [Microbacterium sp. MYb40]PRB19479.1 folate-binding protein YgfZ [Microbacterium sp. MYb54]PRB24814.1 folate-binding protein YgfZ [Microbacterium sp. MYb50]PRB62988.1 folate-binding protein YgfZ [Microbacterium sp. MYb24]
MTRFSQIDGVVSDGDLIMHFGDAFREQRRLADGAALAPLGDRTVIEVAGPERLTWLDSITSQAVGHLAPGESTELLVLDPQGRVEHAAGVLDDGASTWLIADAGDAEALAGWLTRMKFRTQATVGIRSDLMLVGYIDGGTVASAASAAPFAPNGLPLVWADPWQRISVGGHQYSEVAEHPAADFAWRVAILTDEAADALAASLDRDALAGLLAAEALRVAAWRPRWTTEVDERSLPHESDWIRSAVHLNKGCYRGQETVAKVHNLGHPPRRLAALHLDGSDAVLPEPGAPVFAGDDEVGHLTSVARHHEDGPIALAILSRRAPIGDLVVRADGIDIAASQQVIVPADAGATADIPRLTRLSRRPSAPDPRSAGN